jgi:hypothetical protein
MRFPISGLPAAESGELCVFEASDNEEIAESIDEVRRGGRAVSAGQCCGGIAAIGDRVLVGELSESGGFTTESEKLRGVTFVSRGRGYLEGLVSIGRGRGGAIAHWNALYLETSLGTVAVGETPVL